MERGFEVVFDQRIHSYFALISVQSVAFPSAISIVHFGVRTAGTAPELMGLAIVAWIKDTTPKQPIATKATCNHVRFLIANSLLGVIRRMKLADTIAVVAHPAAN
jgi:hypothetical protein